MKTSRSTAMLLLVSLLMVSELALAGTGGTFLDGFKSFMIGSLQGTLGTVIGLGGLIYGLVSGIGRGSLAGLGIGAGLAAGSYYGPDIISAMSTMTLAVL